MAYSSPTFGRSSSRSKYAAQARAYLTSPVSLAQVENRIGRGTRGNLRTTLEKLATAASVEIESMEPQASPAHERYRETKVEVALKEVSLPQTVRYLHEIESTEQALSIKALRIRTRTDKPELLDVTFTVSSFEQI